jgi:hypothetical protein
MSYTSSKMDKDENAYNYGDTFKEDKERTSLSNVFNQNLGRSGVNYEIKNEILNENNYNHYSEINQNKEFYAHYNSDEEKLNNLDHHHPVNEENDLKVAENVEMFEDKNNHVEEFNEEANGECREEIENMMD